MTGLVIRKHLIVCCPANTGSIDFWISSRFNNADTGNHSVNNFNKAGAKRRPRKRRPRFGVMERGNLWSDVLAEAEFGPSSSWLKLSGGASCFLYSYTPNLHHSFAKVLFLYAIICVICACPPVFPFWLLVDGKWGNSTVSSAEAMGLCFVRSRIRSWNWIRVV
jgi:hypothetical protein